MPAEASSARLSSTCKRQIAGVWLFLRVAGASKPQQCVVTTACHAPQTDLTPDHTVDRSAGNSTPSTVPPTESSPGQRRRHELQELMRKDERATPDLHGLMDDLSDNAGRDRVVNVAAEFDTVEHGAVVGKVSQDEQFVVCGTHRECNL